MNAHVTPVQLIVAEVCVIPVAVIPVGTPQVVTVKFTALAVPMAEGELLTTRMRYFVAPFVLVGITALIVPELPVLLNVPMLIGTPNVPVLLESCAV